jgi:hypothetical protein
MTLTRDQILRKGEWQDKVPVVKTMNYMDSASAGKQDDVLLDIPSLRGK